MQTTRSDKPNVLLVGDADHAEFVEAVSLLRATARVACGADMRQAVAISAAAGMSPELIILAASRPGVVRAGEVERLRRAVPLAGVVTMLGSWCEGETRTGRPPAGVGRLYWYDFPNWWRRQVIAWTAGRCPDWARFDKFGSRNADHGFERARSSPTPASLVVLDTTCRETADALANVLQPAGFATAWTGRGRTGWQIRGATAGIWEGRQLDDAESPRLATFCRGLAGDAAPVVALLDFPRGDRVAIAQRIGAAAVLGKPWLNDDLVGVLQEVVGRREYAASSRIARAA